jgi:maltoporin
LLKTGGGQYEATVDDSNTTITRQRTVFVGQYVLPVQEKHSVSFLGEIHLLPSNSPTIGAEAIQPADIGYVAGAKFRAELGSGSFNETSLRYGGGIANGAFGGSSTWDTQGVANEDGKYGGALGLEFVDHFLYNVNPMLTINAYALAMYSKGASGESTDWAMNAAVGARSFLYITDHFHLINELSYQAVIFGLPEGVETPPLPYEVKFTVAPTLVPSGERSAWARPHLRFIYTLAVFSEGARNAYSAGPLAGRTTYFNQFGPRTFGHYLGIRAEWWF